MNNVIELIISSKDKPISSSKLCEIFGVSGIEIRRIINAARCEGCPICSCHKGYYYSENPEDINRTIATLQHRVDKIQSAIKGLSMTLRGGC